MRRGLPRREMVFLEKWYEDYMLAKYGPPPEASDHPTEEEIIANAAWDATTITGGQT